jgi:hypothetical protein
MNNDRWFFIQLYRWFPSILQALTITLVRWHRAGFRRYWRWKSCSSGRGSRHSCAGLIRRRSIENPLWGAPRIHGELLKLGFAAQSSVAKYMFKRHAPPNQGWRTFLVRLNANLIPVCTENLIRVDDVMESPKLAE